MVVQFYIIMELKLGALFTFAFDGPVGLLGVQVGIRVVTLAPPIGATRLR